MARQFDDLVSGNGILPWLPAGLRRAFHSGRQRVAAGALFLVIAGGSAGHAAGLEVPPAIRSLFQLANSIIANLDPSHRSPTLEPLYRVEADLDWRDPGSPLTGPSAPAHGEEIATAAELPAEAAQSPAPAAEPPAEVIAGSGAQVATADPCGTASVPSEDESDSPLPSETPQPASNPPSTGVAAPTGEAAEAPDGGVSIWPPAQPSAAPPPPVSPTAPPGGDGGDDDGDSRGEDDGAGDEAERETSEDEETPEPTETPEPHDVTEDDD
jgi:hypothetical protein